MFYSAHSTWRPSDQLQIILDSVRSSWRRLYERSPMSKQTIEEAIAEVKKHGMYFTNLYERREGGWQCFLRYSANGLLAESGFGADAQECIFHALRKAEKSGYVNRDLPAPKHNNLGLAGEKSPAQLVAYAAPLSAELPNDLGASDEALGIRPVIRSPEEGPAGDVVSEFDTIEDEDDDLLGTSPIKPGAKTVVHDDADEFF